MTAPVEAWAVEGPDGRIMVDTVRRYQYQAQDAALWLNKFMTWNMLQRRGYRFVRVTIAVKASGNDPHDNPSLAHCGKVCRDGR